MDIVKEVRSDCLWNTDSKNVLNRAVFSEPEEAERSPNYIVEGSELHLRRELTYLWILMSLFIAYKNELDYIHIHVLTFALNPSTAAPQWQAFCNCYQSEQTSHSYVEYAHDSDDV